MPTGYTALINEGVTFEKFVLQCARAFGALIMMRDDSSDAPIPDEFKPSDYHIKELAKSELQLKELLSLSKEQIKVKAAAAYKNEVNQWQKREDEKAEQKDKYEEMLAKVVEWKAPSTDHIGLKEFMIEQIKGSIDFDCKPYEKPKKKNPDQWYAAQIKAVNWSIDYHTKEQKDEEKRARDRTEWVRKLKTSLNIELANKEKKEGID